MSSEEHGKWFPSWKRYSPSGRLSIVFAFLAFGVSSLAPLLAVFTDVLAGSERPAVLAATVSGLVGLTLIYTYEAQQDIKEKLDAAETRMKEEMARLKRDAGEEAASLFNKQVEHLEEHSRRFPLHWLQNWGELYEQAQVLVGRAEREVLATDFGEEGGTGPQYLDALVRRASHHHRADNKTSNPNFRYRLLLSPVKARSEAIRIKVKRFFDEGVVDCLELHTMTSDPRLGLDLLVVDGRHLIIAFHQLNKGQLRQGLMVLDEPRFVQEAADWFHDLLGKRARRVKNVLVLQDASETTVVNDQQ